GAGRGADEDPVAEDFAVDGDEEAQVLVEGDREVAWWAGEHQSGPVDLGDEVGAIPEAVGVAVCRLGERGAGQPAGDVERAGGVRAIGAAAVDVEVALVD